MITFIVIFALWGLWEIGLMPLWVAITCTVCGVFELIDYAYKAGDKRR